MTFLAWIWNRGFEQLEDAFSMGATYGAPVLLGALVCAALFYAHRRGSRGRKASLRGFIRSTFVGRILLHPSSLIDMRLWTLNTLVFASAYGLLILSASFWREATLHLLTGVFGAHAPLAWPAWTVLALATVLQLLAFELGYWFGHYLFHVVPSLWEFHKVHHSAEVMTTFTELRQHPVEIIAVTNAEALCTGLVFGAMTYAFGAGVRPFTLLNGNIALMLFLMTIGHLRHSHMWIPFTGWLGKLLQSPAHHQIHHSDNPRHFNMNLGYSLALWDWLFGTLYLPTEKETIRFGVGARHIDFSSTLRLYVMPFVRAGERLKEAVAPQKAMETAPAPPALAEAPPPRRKVA